MIREVLRGEAARAVSLPAAWVLAQIAARGGEVRWSTRQVATWFSPEHDVPLERVVEAMEELVSAGAVEVVMRGDYGAVGRIAGQAAPCDESGLEDLRRLWPGGVPAEVAAAMREASGGDEDILREAIRKTVERFEGGRFAPHQVQKYATAVIRGLRSQRARKRKPHRPPQRPPQATASRWARGSRGSRDRDRSGRTDKRYYGPDGGQEALW